MKTLHSFKTQTRVTSQKAYLLRASSFNLLVIILYILSSASALAQIKTNGRFVYNHCGQKVIFRGVEHMIYYKDVNGDQIAEIAKTGANYVRLMLDAGISETQPRSLLQKCIDQNLYISVAIWKPWLNQDFWLRPDVKSVLAEFENFIVIHGYGEAEFSDDYVRWQNTCKTCKCWHLHT